MTSQLFVTPTAQFLFAELTAKIDMLPSASVVSDDPLDIEYLQDTISNYFPSQSFATEYYADFSTMTSQPQATCKVVVARITMDGFFDFLKEANKKNITVIALVDTVPEEVVTARFLGLQYVIKPDLLISGNIHQLFSNEKAAV
jgi:hypothetical protein